jgi:transposase
VPKQYSTGGKTKLYGISKRGDCYLRKNLVHGGRSMVNTIMRSKTPDKYDRGLWIQDLYKRVGPNRSAVAFAHKLARTIWALLTKGEEYRGAPA